MALEEFYRELYHDVFLKWVLLNSQDYLKDQVICKTEEKNDQFYKILFDMNKICGYVTVWYNNIIEEEIYNKETNDMLFYLHYTIVDLSQAKSLFQEFYSTLLKHNHKKIIRIGLCSTGGLSTTVFADEMKEVCQKDDTHFELTALTLEEIDLYYKDYNALYLAPQIAYLQPELIISTNHLIPIHCIDPTDFATKNYQAIAKTIQENLIKDTKCRLK